MSGSLFVIEGPEGSFKSTVANKVVERLCQQGICAISSREPGGVEIAEKIRDIVVHDDMCIETEILLFLAARMEHYDKFIKPHLNDGKLIVLDRFVYSSLSIQGAARGYDIDTINSLHGLLLPNDLKATTFYIDVDPRSSLRRKTGNDIQKFEKENISFHLKAHEFMLEACKEYYDIIKIPGGDGKTRTSDDIANDIVAIIKLIHLGYSVINVNNN